MVFSLATGVAFMATTLISAQVVRPYTLIYSDNIRGGHTIIGNTITAVYSSGSGSTGTVNLAQMNDFSTSGTGSYTNGRTSAYGNDNSNIQFVDVDGIIPSTPLIISGDFWNYSSTNAQPASWPAVNTLPDGPGATPLGYGPTGTVKTTLTDRRTYYFTKTVTLNPALYSSFTFSLTLDDGAVVYVNGVEAGRINMGTGPVDYNTDASSNIEPEQLSSFTVTGTSLFINGSNTIQVEVHTSASNETGTDDLYFDLALDGNAAGQTTNSSSANLTLPAGTNTVKFARLYWGGRISDGIGVSDNLNLRTAKIKFNSEGYQTLTAAAGAIDKSLINTSTSDSAYEVYFDVTAYVNQRKSGTYSVADITASTGAISGGGYFGGWSLVVVYENLSLSYSSVRVYDGYLQVFQNGSVTSQTITLNGLNPPATFLLPSDAYMSMVAWEGDANLAASDPNPNGDFIKVNGKVVSDAVNPSSNFWNGTISRNGAHLEGMKNPDFKNQMGIDIDEVQIGSGYGLSPSTTDVSVEFGTEADQYFPSIFAFTMQTRPPQVQLDKMVKDTASGNEPWQIPNNVLNPNEILTYTIVGKNQGNGNAMNCVIADTIPGGLTYRTESLRVNAPTPGITPGIKTEAGNDDAAQKSSFGGKDYVKFFIGTGATGTSGGILAPNDSFSVQFQCIVPPNASALNFVSNTARITGTEQDGTTPFVDDGTAIIGPLGIGLPVQLTEFTVQKENSNAVLQWTTVTEMKNDHFDIERSTDGVHFTTMGTVNGKGTTAVTNHYVYYDPVAGIREMLYYRLKIVDMDNKGFYSRVIALRPDGSPMVQNVTVYPNPFQGNVRLLFNSTQDMTITIRISNMSGQTESQNSVSVQKGQNIIVVSNSGAISAGSHIMEIIWSDGRVTQKIIKQ